MTFAYRRIFTRNFPCNRVPFWIFFDFLGRSTPNGTAGASNHDPKFADYEKKCGADLTNWPTKRTPATKIFEEEKGRGKNGAGLIVGPLSQIPLPGAQPLAAFFLSPL